MKGRILALSSNVQFAFGSGFYGVFDPFMLKLQGFLVAQGGHQVYVYA